MNRAITVLCGLVWCGIFGDVTSQGAERAGAVPVKPGVQRMAERLRQKIVSEDPMSNAFRNRERAAILLDRIAREKSPEGFWPMLPHLATEQLNSGNPRAALATLDRFDQIAAEYQHVLTPAQKKAFLHQRAVCNLRIGEQQNCLTNHTIQSCLFPIRDLGIYHNKTGPREAIRILTGCLEQFPGDLKAVWLLNIAYMTIGEYPEKVPAQWLLAPKLFESEHDIKPFVDVASGAGLDNPGWAGGCVIEDFDGDGFLDVIVSSWEIRTQMRFFKNNGDGTFTERTREAGLTGLLGGLNMVQADYNNDGWTDVFVLRGAWLSSAGKYPNSLLRNNGDGTFEDVTEEAGLLSFHPTQTGVWFDFDGNGWLDLFIGNESFGTNVHPSELYRNNGDGTFTECAKAVGINVDSYIKGVVSGDFDNDGRPDLYLSSRSGFNFLLHNDGPQGGPDRSAKTPWRFTNIARAAGVTLPRMSFPTAAFDFNNDGWQDILVTGYALQGGVGDVAAEYLGKPYTSERTKLYRNKGDGTFADVSKEYGLDRLIFAMSLNFGDYDNDGWLDFLAGTGDPDFATVVPNAAFRNADGKKFQNVTTSAGLGHLQKGHAIAFADIDNDGDQDIFEVIGGAYTDDTYRPSLLKNPGHGNRWITLKLEGRQSNRSAFGARIKVATKTAAGPRAIYKTVSSGASFGASPLRQEIGLGKAESIESVEVLWPTTGKTQSFTGLAMDKGYQIIEGETQAKPLNLRSFALRPPLDKLCAPPGTAMPPAVVPAAK